MSKNQTKSEKEELITVKVTAKAELIYQVLGHLQEHYPPESMSVSKMLKNMHDPDYHVFCIIRLPTKNSEGLPLQERV